MNVLRVLVDHGRLTAPLMEQLRAEPGIERVTSDADVVITDKNVTSAKCEVWNVRCECATHNVLRGKTVTGGEILRNGPDQAVLDRWLIQTDLLSAQSTAARNEDTALRRTVRLCRLMLAGADPGARYESPLPMLPSANGIRLKSVVAARKLKIHLASLYEHESWKVALVKAPVHRFLDAGFRPEFHIVRYHRPGQFLADPFLIDTDDGARLLVEEFDYRTNLGRIAEVQWPDVQVLTAIEETFHLSNPFPFPFDNKLYCIPESYQANCVRLYSFDGEGWRWERNLISDFAGVDANIIRYHDRWWLFCTNKNDEVDAALYIWHAPHPFGPWTPHVGNPVKVDPRSSRPGGTPFIFEGALYRPAQDCSQSYGWRLAINKVTQLTPSAFAEEVVRIIDPPAPYEGIHTLAGSGEMTVVDLKKPERALRFAGQRLAHKLRRLTG